MVPINYLAVLLCGVIAVALGFLWYGPLFGKAWMKTMGMDMDAMTPEEKAKGMKSMWKSAVIAFVGAVITGFVLSHVIAFANAYFGTSGVVENLQGAFWSWLGFIAPVVLASVLWEKRSMKYWYISAGYQLVLLALMSIVITLLPA